MKEIEEKFFKEEAEEVFKEYKKKVLINILKNEERLRMQILDILSQISKKSNEDEGLKIKYIDCSLLKIGILNETYEVAVTAYDGEWYAGNKIETGFSIDYIFDGLKEIKTVLYDKIRKYVGKIRKSSVDYYILRQTADYNNYLTYFFIKYLKQYDEEISFNEMNKDVSLRIIYGNYKDYSQTVYYYESFKKDEKKFKDELERSRKGNLIFSQWTSLKAEKFQIENNDLTCMNFKKAALENFIVKESRAVGINFKESLIKRCKFISCDLGNTDFSNAHLEDMVFEECNLRNIKFDNAELTNVYVINNGKTMKIINKSEQGL